MPSLKPLAFALSWAVAALVATGQAYLTPFDFGLKPLPHGRIDYTHTPPNVQVGNFDSDCYPDIARFAGDKLEVYIFQGNGYPARPSGERIFPHIIKSLRLDSYIWDNVDNLIVTLGDGTEDTLFHHGACLDLEIPTGFLTQGNFPPPPRYVNDYDFQIVWESDPRPYGMDRCAVGDIDNDGINELVTWFRPGPYVDSAYALIYKSTGDNQYEIFMQEPLTMDAGNSYVSFMLIADLDRNGQQELIYMANRVYFWEFSAPGSYVAYKSNFLFARGVTDAKVCDVDQDSVLELAIVTATGGLEPPCYYMVDEFSNKVAYGLYYYYVFIPIQDWWQDWMDYRLAVGDFDNDGVVDIVSGNSAMVGGYDPIDIQYFRYDTSGIANFTREMLHTGIPLSCATPVIGDLDGDGDNELFAGGLSPNGSSAFVWESTGQGTGYPAWIDTSTMIDAPDEAVSGLVDDQVCVLCTTSPWINGSHGLLYLFGPYSPEGACLWQSPLLDSLTLHSPLFLDMDQDSRQNLITGAWIISSPDEVWDWEQSSSGLVSNPGESKPNEFDLLQNYPNPFNSGTIIPFSIPRKADIRLTIYDAMACQVFTEGIGELSPGEHAVFWDASAQSSGIYFAVLTQSKTIQAIKMLLLK